MVTQNDCNFGTGTAGQVLTSNGTAVAPTFQTVSVSVTLTGDTGGAISPSAGNFNIIANQPSNTCGASVLFSGAGSTLTLNASDVASNTFFGNLAGSLSINTANLCSGFGEGALAANTDGVFCNAFGASCLNSCNANVNNGFGTNCLFNLSSGIQNCGFGHAALFSTGTSSNNTAIGYISMLNYLNGNGSNTSVGFNSLVALQTGESVIAVGANAGTNYSTSESSNIVIGNLGTAAESNVIRIGTQGAGVAQQNQCFIAGIDGATVTGAAVLCSSSGQLGDIVSSVRFKEEIKDVENSSDLLNLRPVTFKYKSDEKKTVHYGLIAEEVEKIFPSLVIYDNNKQPYSVAYHEMPALLLQEIKKLRKEVEELKLKIN